MLLRFDRIGDLDGLTQHLCPQPLEQPSIMPMDAYRDGDRFVVLLDLPGIEPGSLDVTVNRNMLTVSAQRDWQPPAAEQIMAAERPTGSLQRQVYLSEGL